MGIFDSKEKKLAKKYARQDKVAAKARAKSVASREKKHTRSMSKLECAGELSKCKAAFERTIRLVSADVRERSAYGYECEKERQQIKDAAIGILVVDEALYQLDRSNTEDSFYEAMALLDTALRQQNKIIGKTQVPNTNRLNRDVENLKENMEPDGPVLPERFAEQVNDDFIESLIAGKSFEDSLKNARTRPDVSVAYREGANPYPGSGHGQRSSSEIEASIKKHADEV